MSYLMHLSGGVTRHAIGDYECNSHVPLQTASNSLTLVVAVEFLDGSYAAWSASGDLDWRAGPHLDDQSIPRAGCSMSNDARRQLVWQ